MPEKLRSCRTAADGFCLPRAQCVSDVPERNPRYHISGLVVKLTSDCLVSPRGTAPYTLANGSLKPRCAKAPNKCSKEGSQRSVELLRSPGTPDVWPRPQTAPVFAAIGALESLPEVRDYVRPSQKTQRIDCHKLLPVRPAATPLHLSDLVH